jgi:hypothetical protein
LPSMCKEAFVLMPNTEKIIIVIITLKWKNTKLYAKESWIIIFVKF